MPTSNQVLESEGIKGTRKGPTGSGRKGVHTEWESDRTRLFISNSESYQ